MSSIRTAAAVGLAALVASACGGRDSTPPPARVLVFTRTLGFRHASLPVAAAAVQALAEREGLQVQTTEDPSVFRADVLGGFSAVVFLLTTGEVLDAPAQQALQSYVRSGGGFLGIHSAADTGHAWPWYLELVGAEFASHPDVQAAAIVREDRVHPATAALPDRWTRTDEWYDFRSSPRGKVRVLLSVDESTYRGGGMGADHPIAWCQAFEGGRSAYTALGHTIESWSEPLFLEHIRGALRWSAGLAPGGCAP